MQTTVRLTINGREVVRDVEPRRLLVEFLRQDLGLTGTHVGCDSSQCGACTILLDGKATKSCTIFAVQADGSEVLSIEGVETADGLHPVQRAFRAKHALQCGFCTPGMVMLALDLLKRMPSPDETTIRWGLEGNICRCTGYQNIVEAIQAASQEMAVSDR